MLVAIDRSKVGPASRCARAVLSRYLWRIATGIYVGHTSYGLRRITDELTEIGGKTSGLGVIMVIVDKTEARGVRVEKLTSTITEA